MQIFHEANSQFIKILNIDPNFYKRGHIALYKVILNR